MKLKKFTKFIAIILILGSILDCGIFGGDDKDKDKNRNNLLLLGLASLRGRTTSGTRDMYAGFADIPASIYKTVSSGSASSSVQEKVVASADFKFQNSSNSASVSSVYDLVKITAKSTRDIAKSVGDLVKALEALNVGTIQGTSSGATDGWANQPSKYRYGTSTTISGGKKLEVWWNNAPAPYANNKAIEMNYSGSSTSNITGYIFCRFLSKTGDTTLGKAYIKFDYNATTNIRTMVVILQDIGPTFTDKAHFFVKEENGVTTMDGGFTANNFNPSSTSVTASNRIYVFNASGDANRAVVNAALPLQTDTTSAIYANTTLGNIGQVWTNFILANATTVTAINGIGATGACNTITNTTAQGGNPTTLLPTFSVAALKTCFDANNPGTNFKDVYFITNIKNPAYFSIDGNTVKLYGVESLDASEANKSAFDTLQNLLPLSTRVTTNTTYAADFSPVGISSLNIFTGVNVPIGTTANTLPSINAVWGNTLSTGTSTANPTANVVNGTKDDTAPF